MRKLLLLFVLMFLINTAFSQLYFRNSTNQNIYIAVGWYSDNGKYELSDFMTKGWFTVKPGQKISPLYFTSNDDFFYYYAYTKDGRFEWSGSTKLLVSDNAFTIKNANSKDVKIKNPNYYWKNFVYKKVHFKTFEKKVFTVNFNLSDHKKLGYTIFNGTYKYKDAYTEASAMIYQKGSSNKYYIEYELATTLGCMSYFDGYGYRSNDKLYFSNKDINSCKLIFSILPNKKIKLINATTEKCSELIGVKGCSYALGIYNQN